MTDAQADKNLVTAWVSCPSATVASAIAKGLVTQQLAACVSIIPSITSVYQWEGALCETPEALLLIKTTRSAVPTMISWVTSNHPYDCPEVIVQCITGGYEPYLSWVAQQSTGQKVINN